jgi:hypothetical protein
MHLKTTDRENRIQNTRRGLIFFQKSSLLNGIIRIGKQMDGVVHSTFQLHYFSKITSTKHFGNNISIFGID